jgi:hypothetical protein
MWIYKVLQYGGLAIVLHGLFGLGLLPLSERTQVICIGAIGIGLVMFLLSLTVARLFED